jgi:hypothetical protein
MVESKTRNRIYVFVAGMFVCLTSNTLHAVTFHVATDGNDAWSGSQAKPNAQKSDGPFATLAGARNAIRRLKSQKPLAEPVQVIVAGGVYPLKETIVFEPQDSGTAATPIMYRAADGTRPVLSGGRAITGFKRGEGALWVADIPDAAGGKWQFRQLFVNGRRACRARTPNEGYLHVEGLVETTKDPKKPETWEQPVDRFRFKACDIHAWKDLGDVEIVVFHSWNTSRERIAAVDEKDRVVRLAGMPISRLMAWDPQQRYYIENTREALDSPGEWYLDRQTGKLYYWPLVGEDPTKAEVVAPVLQELVRFDGKPDNGAFVDYIQLEGLAFQHADWTLPASGYGDPQAAVTVPSAVWASGARHCAIERCEIAHVGTYGVWFSRGCKENRIVQNHIHDLGAGSVRIGENFRAPTDVAESSGNLVSNNYLHDGGHVYAGAVGVWVAQSSHNTISHNEIHSFDYSGMSIGWNWDYTPNRGHHNRIEYNHIHHVVRGVLSDAGGIYTLGPQTGTVIRNNLLHDIWPYMGNPAMAWGIYFDAGSSEMLVENNIVYHTLTGGIMGTAAPGNVVRNNIFALSAWQAAWRWNLPNKNPPTLFERNIFYVTQGDLFQLDGGQSDVTPKWDHNLYWRTDGQPLMFYGDELAEWQTKGMDRHGLVADPQFVDPAHGDFSLKPGSPALKLGFQPIDASQIGLQGPPEWVNLPKSASFPPTVLPKGVSAWQPTPIDDGFETTAEGERPAMATVFEEGRGDSIRVTSETAATGKHSLKFTDVPGLEHSFNPHLYYSPRFTHGRATLSFDLRREQGAVVGHEWRDAAQPYRVGPSLQIDANGKLMAGTKHLIDVPLQQWVHVEVACNLGKEAQGMYDLSVTLPGKPPKVFSGLPCGSANFRQLQWLGFVSQVDGKAVFYLDNISLH